MGAKQSSPVFDSRTRAYSSSDLPSGNSSGGERIAGFRYTNGPDGPRIRYTGGGPTSSGLSIPAGGRSGSHVLNQSLDGTDGDDEGQLPPEGHRLLIGSLPAHLSPHLLGGKIVMHGLLQIYSSYSLKHLKKEVTISYNSLLFNRLISLSTLKYTLSLFLSSIMVRYPLLNYLVIFYYLIFFNSDSVFIFLSTLYFVIFLTKGKF